MSVLTSPNATYLLSLGDGETSDHLQLYVEPDGFIANPPDRNATTRDIQLAVTLAADSADALWGQVQAIEQKLVQARELAGAGTGSGVTLGVTIRTTTMVYFDVLSGNLTIDRRYPSGSIASGVLNLTCLPYARGDAVTISETATLTNAADSEVWLADIKGDVPPLTRLTISDKSTNGAVINRLRIGRRAGHDLSDGDYQSIVNLTADSDGTATTDASDYLGADFVRVSTSGTDWTRFGTITRPTTQTVGELDIWLRARDPVGIIDKPTGLDATFTGARAQLVQHTVTSVEDPGRDMTVDWPEATAAGTTLILVFMTEDHFVDVYMDGLGWTERESESATITHASADNDRVIRLFDWLEHDGERDSERFVFNRTITGIVSVNLFEFRGIDTFINSASNVEDTNTTTHSSGESASSATTKRLLITGHNIAEAVTDYTADWTLVTRGLLNQTAYRLVDDTSAYTGTATSSASTQSVNLIASYGGDLPSSADLPAGDYAFQVAGLDGEESGYLSEMTYLNVPYAGRANIDWTGVDQIDDYRLWYKRDDEEWKYENIRTGLTTSDLDTDDGTTGDPQTDRFACQVRALVASGTNGEILATLEPVSTVVGAGSNRSADEWYDVHLASQQLPPGWTAEGATADDWVIYFEVKQEQLDVDFDADYVWLPPHREPQVDAIYVGTDGTAMGNTTKRDWQIDVDRHGQTTVRLLNQSTSAVVASWKPNGRFMLGPGGNLVTILAAIEDGITDVSDAQFTVSGQYVPRYRFLSSD